VVGATPTTDLGWSNHPQAQGGGPANPKGQTKKKKKKKKKKRKMGFGLFGGGRTTPKGLGWLWTPHTGRRGPPPSPWGWSGHPQKSKPIFRFFFFFFWGLLGVAGPPPWTWGWFDHPRPTVGVAPATPWPKWGGPTTPFLAKGWLEPPPIFIFFFFIFFDFHLFFFKKKKN
jgi:hypothetical protein